MKERRPPVARNERKAIMETAMRPCRCALGKGSISNVTWLVNRRSSSFPKGSVLCMRLIRARAAIFDGVCVVTDQTMSCFVEPSDARTGNERETGLERISTSDVEVETRSTCTDKKTETIKRTIDPLTCVIPRASPQNDQTGKMKDDKGGK